MNYAAFIDELQILINKKVTYAEIAKILGCSRANISKKVATLSSEVTVSDLIKIQKYYGIIFPELVLNTFEPVDNINVLKNYNFFGLRLSKIQEKVGYMDKAMARIMNIDESLYIKMKNGKENATSEQLARLASKIEISIDWLIKG